MKQTKTRILGLLLAVLMVFSLTACGNNGKPTDPNLIKLGDYELLYKDACLMEDFDGADALVLTLDFTNNSKEMSTYFWSVYGTAMQNDTELESAIIYTDYDAYEMIDDNQFEEVDPGATLEVQVAYVLEDTTSEVEVTFEEMIGSKNGKITIDPSALSRMESTSSPQSSEPTDDPVPNDSTLLDWWNGDWYGWWIMTGCAGYYEDMEGQWWDICGTIDIGEDYMGTVALWDEDYTESEPMVSAAVSLSESGTGEYGAMMSEGGFFTDIELEHADWIVDPGLVDYPDMIHIQGYYESDEDEYSYDIYLRPWGTYWDDVEEEDLPAFYDDWYLPLIVAGEAMPDSIGTGAPAGGSTSAQTGTIPGGDGIVTEEQVQMGYVYMKEVAKDLFHTTYEELAAYFGVEGQFVEEYYSDVYEANMRFYKWISSENSNHFVYVNFLEEEPGVYRISAYNTSGFSGSEAIDKYLEIVKAEAAEQDKVAAANAVMKDFSIEVKDPMTDNVIKISTVLPESGWSSKKDTIVENEDPDAFGAGTIVFKLRESMEKLESNKDSYKNFQEGEDRVIGGITFKCRTYEYIGYDWIEYVAQIDDGRFLSVGLTDLDCVPGTMPDIILSNMKFQ